MSRARPDGSPILLMSQLAAHRRHIAADPRVSLLFYCRAAAIRWRIRASLFSAGERVDDAARGRICARAFSPAIRNPRFMRISPTFSSSAGCVGEPASEWRLRPRRAAHRPQILTLIAGAAQLDRRRARGDRPYQRRSSGRSRSSCRRFRRTRQFGSRRRRRRRPMARDRPRSRGSRSRKRGDNRARFHFRARS